MRIWTLHPKYLDPKGLVALWRETLLAQNVLLERTHGYRNHPQLIRFRQCSNPLGAIATYLREVAREADARGYNFDKGKIIQRRFNGRLTVTEGQLEYEFAHLLHKLSIRAPGRYAELASIRQIRVHELFGRVPGGVEHWERTGD